MAKRTAETYGLKTIIVAFCTLILLCITIGVIALRFGNVIPDDVDVYFIVPRHPSGYTEDESGVWENEKQADIFSTNYVNGNGEMTVVSQDGKTVIAPGTVSEYKFCMYNDGNMALAYHLSFSFALRVNDEERSADVFPLSIRLKKTDGEYLLGGEGDWAALTSGEIGKYAATVGANSYEEFTLELMWAFENNDELDTAIGNEAVHSSVNLKFVIESYAEEHSDPKAQGGVVVSELAEYGGTIRWEPYLVVLIALAVCILFL